MEARQLPDDVHAEIVKICDNAALHKLGKVQKYPRVLVQAETDRRNRKKWEEDEEGERQTLRRQQSVEYRQLLIPQVYCPALESSSDSDGNSGFSDDDW